jgi:hypothetical protein
VREETKKGKAEHKTMGYAKEPLPQPSDFLKKHEKEFVLPERMPNRVELLPFSSNFQFSQFPKQNRWCEMKLKNLVYPIR